MDEIAETPTKAKSSPQTEPKTPVNSRLPHFLLEQTPERECERQECPTCLSPLNRIDHDLTETNCKHWFHTPCLAAMKERHIISCPICRQNLTPPQNYRGRPNQSNAPYIPIAANVHYDYIPTATQAQIVLAAQRGRNAVRMALERQRLQQELLDEQFASNEFPPVLSF